MSPVMNSPSDVKGLSPTLVGLAMGVSAALPMYLWQSTVQIAVATFVIAAYTSFLWTRVHNHAVFAALRHGELRGLPINAWPHRVFRMLGDPAFWWTMIFGGAVVTGSVHWAGLTEPATLGGVFVAWVGIAASLSYGLTMIHPGARCRRCGYDLTGQVLGDDAMVICSECGARWSRAQLGLTRSTVDWRHVN